MSKVMNGLIEAQKELSMQKKRELKSRIFYELVLGIISMIFFLYSYNYKIGLLEIDSKNVQIPFLSLEIPLISAFPFFPSILAISYILMMSSIEKLITIQRKQFSTSYKYFGRFPSEDTLFEQEASLRRGTLIVPSSINFDPIVAISVSHISSMLRLISILFISIIYVCFPYYVIIYSIIVIYSINPSILLLSWNIACVLMMIFYFIAILLGASKKRLNVLWEMDGEFLEPYVSHLLDAHADKNQDVDIKNGQS
jgi:hypothetical protein